MKNEKSTFSVLFYLKKDKMKKNGLVPIHARITINGKQTQFNTKLEVLETNWKSGRAIGKSMEIQRLNSMLDDIKANIRSYFHNQLMRDSYVTPESVKNALLGKKEEALTIISFSQQHNDQYKKKVGAGEATPKTYSKYKLSKLHVREYMKDEYRVSDLPIRQINKVFSELQRIASAALNFLGKSLRSRVPNERKVTQLNHFSRDCNLNCVIKEKK